MTEPAELSTAKRQKARGRFAVVIHRPGGEVVEKAAAVPAVWKNTVAGRGQARAFAARLNRRVAAERGILRGRVHVMEIRRKAPHGQLGAWRAASRAPATRCAKCGKAADIRPQAGGFCFECAPDNP